MKGTGLFPEDDLTLPDLLSSRVDIVAAEGRVRATVADRAVHFLVDGLLNGFIATALLSVIDFLLFGASPLDLFRSGEDNTASGFLFYCIQITGFFVFALSAYLITERSSRGRSLGKLITKTRVVKEEGTEVEDRDFFIRNLVRFIPFECLSGLAGRPWHDRWSRTAVVKDDR